MVAEQQIINLFATVHASSIAYSERHCNHEKACETLPRHMGAALKLPLASHTMFCVFAASMSVKPVPQDAVHALPTATISPGVSHVICK